MWEMMFTWQAFKDLNICDSKNRIDLGLLMTGHFETFQLCISTFRGSPVLSQSHVSMAVSKAIQQDVPTCIR